MQGEETGRMDALAVMLWVGDLVGKAAALVVLAVGAVMALGFAIVFVAGVILFAMSRLGRHTEYMTRPD